MPLTSLEAGLLYSALGAFLGATFVGIEVARGRRRGRGLQPMLGVGTVLLGLFVTLMLFRVGGAAFAQRYEFVALIALVVAAGAFFAHGRREGPLLPALAAPTVALLLVFVLVLVPRADGSAPDPALGRAVHIGFAVVGFAGFTVAAAVGVLYLWTIRILKRNPAAAIARRLPALERLDSLNLRAVAIGLPSLALSVFTGWLFVETTRLWWIDPTVLTALGGLLVYGVLLLARAVLGWYGRRIALLSVVGFVFAVVGYVVASFCTSTGTLH